MKIKITKQPVINISFEDKSCEYIHYANLKEDEARELMYALANILGESVDIDSKTILEKDETNNIHIPMRDLKYGEIGKIIEEHRRRA